MKRNQRRTKPKRLSDGADPLQPRPAALPNSEHAFLTPWFSISPLDTDVPSRDLKKKTKKKPDLNSALVSGSGRETTDGTNVSGRP